MWRLWHWRWWWNWKLDRFAFWIAWRLPRRVAKWAFIRVSAITGTCNPTYSEAYDAWEREES
jgi:hypothetical protein